MKSFKNDNVIILQQKVIHLGSEVKRLQSELEKSKNREYLKKLESQYHQWEEERGQWKEEKVQWQEKLTILEEVNKQLEDKWIEEQKNYKSELDKKKKLITQFQEEITNYSSSIQKLEKENGSTVELEALRRKLEQENLGLHKEIENQAKVISELKNFIYQSQEKLTKLEEINKQLEGKWKEEQKNYETELEKKENLEKEITQLQEEIINNTSTIQKLKTENGNIVELEAIRIKLEQENIKLKKDTEEQAKIISELKNFIHQSNQKLEEAEQEWERMNEVVENLKLENIQQHNEAINSVNGVKEKLEKENNQLRKELSIQRAITSDLEEHLIQSNRKVSSASKEYEEARAIISSLKQEIEKNQVEKNQLQAVMEVSEKLEQENIKYHQEIKNYLEQLQRLEEELKGVYEENAVLHDDIAKLHECVGSLEKKAEKFYSEKTTISKWNEKNESLPLSETKENQTETPKIQSWFYNNVKKET
ncbi:hypothetical protein [Sutcliffiella deserti]|uniref:hypothetical protein n=1 Tax=Sutcliffiella deserti TaxID=2875501 RepID=UPI001CBBD244|nr:hypothetical protein [Sutcliffiella deserti]